MNVQRSLREYVNVHGPVPASVAVAAVVGTGDRDATRKAYAALAVDAREGRLDRIAYGLYDRRIP